MEKIYGGPYKHQFQKFWSKSGADRDPVFKFEIQIKDMNEDNDSFSDHWDAVLQGMIGRRSVLPHCMLPVVADHRLKFCTCKF